MTLSNRKKDAINVQNRHLLGGFLPVLAVLFFSVASVDATAASPSAVVANHQAQQHPEDGAIHILDDRGEAHVFTQPPKRIVSLLPSLTESVCILQACDKLVGIDRYSDYPEQIQSLPKVGGGLDPNIEVIVALQPQVVLAAGSSRAALRLESLGIPVIALEPRNFADVERVLRVLSELLQPAAEHNAEVVLAQTKAQLASVASRVPPSLHGKTVYFEVGQGPYAAGAASFIGEILTQMGLVNIVPKQLGAFPKLNPEFVLRADPDIIMLSDSSVDHVVKYPGWRNLRALHNHQLCVFKPAQTNILARPGPRMAEAAQEILGCLNGLVEKASASPS